MMRQDAAEDDAKQRAAKDTPEHDEGDGERVHGGLLLRLREERRKLIAETEPELVLLGRRRGPRWIPCRLQAHIPSAREELADDEVDGDAACVLDEVQGDDRLRLHVPRIWQELGHEGLQGELIDARALGVPREREVLLEEERELPARHRFVDVAERRSGLILAVAHL